MRHPHAWALLRSLARSAFYRTSLHRLASSRAVEPSHRTATYWDAALSGRLRPYLGGTISVDVRNVVTAQLLHAVFPAAMSILDVGCAAGTLAKAVRAVGVRHYVGLDISSVAIREATREAGDFHVVDLCAFEPTDPFDAIVFNEVLYYLDVATAVAQMERYARHLTPHGVLVFSLKNDPKSRAILGAIVRRFAWMTGMLLQEQSECGRYAIHANRERPAYLVAVVREPGTP